MKLRLSDWASFAEILSGIAVVATLIFLVQGINENSEITRAAMYADHTRSFNEQGRDIYSDPELARIFGAWLDEDYSSLDNTDMQRLNQMIAYFFRTYESAFLADQAGLYGAAEWERMARNACANFGRVSTDEHNQMLEALMTRSFMDFLRDDCP